MGILKKVIGKVVRAVWYSRSYVEIIDFPILCRLPQGKWFLCYGNSIGFNVFLYSFFHKWFYKIYDNEYLFLKRILKQNQNIVAMDVGANEGIFTIIMKAISDDCIIYAFEPSPRIYKRLKRNISLNRFNNVFIENCCLGSYEGITEFYECQRYQTGHSSIKCPAEDTSVPKKILKVPITTLDSYVNKKRVKKLDFIKVDIEGGELDFLKGGVATISKFKPTIMAEVHDLRTKQWGYRAFDIYNFLKQLGYNWYEIREGGILKEISFKEKDVIEYENLVAIHIDKLNQFKEMIS